MARSFWQPKDKNVNDEVPLSIKLLHPTGGRGGTEGDLQTITPITPHLSPTSSAHKKFYSANPRSFGSGAAAR